MKNEENIERLKNKYEGRRIYIGNPKHKVTGMVISGDRMITFENEHGTIIFDKKNGFVMEDRAGRKIDLDKEKIKREFRGTNAVEMESKLEYEIREAQT